MILPDVATSPSYTEKLSEKECDQGPERPLVPVATSQCPETYRLPSQGLLSLGGPAPAGHSQVRGPASQASDSSFVVGRASSCQSLTPSGTSRQASHWPLLGLGRLFFKPLSIQPEERLSVNYSPFPVLLSLKATAYMHAPHGQINTTAQIRTSPRAIICVARARWLGPDQNFLKAACV